MPAALIAPLAAAVVLGLAAGVLALQRLWQRRLVGTTVGGARPALSNSDRPDILYFTGVNCTVCHVAQRPALARLRSLLGDVNIKEIDVAREPALARDYRVMTLPTTVVLDSAGRTAALNVGFVSERELRDQVETARATSPHVAGACA